jgi:NAD(P)-dependent dehydrogenase (short-subunit alcohol dehydrogenase family)
MSRNRFEGKVAVVTGGNSGIGLATAKAFAKEGAQVVITGRDAASLAKAQTEIGGDTVAIQSDVARVPEIEKAIKQIADRFGRIDALFINAGIGKFIPMEAVTEAFYDEIFDVNLKGAYFTIQKTLPLMGKGSAIVLNASINGHMGMPGASVYGASKAGLINLAQGVSAEVVERGIRVNVVSPGPIKTPIFARMGMPPEQEQKTREAIVAQVPMKRFGEPEEIAGAVLFLCSAEASFIIGAELIVDGGMVTI